MRVIGSGVSAWRVLRVLVGVTVLASALVGVAPAAAKPPPASNGQILFLKDSVITTVNPDGSHPNGLITADCARWSPDGSVISTCGAPDGIGSTLLLDPLNGTVLKELVPPDEQTLFLACYVWSPNGTRLACEQYQPPADLSLSGLYTVRASDGSDIQRLTSSPGGPNDCVGDYSPDGSRFVFERTDPRRPARANTALFVVNVHGSGLRQITPWGFPNQDCAGSWSPSGHWILFDSRSGKIFVVHPDGTDLHQIPLAGVRARSFAFQPSWSPDGTKFVFGLFTSRAPATGQEGIYKANANGTGVQPVDIAPPGGHDDSPDWGTHPLAGP